MVGAPLFKHVKFIIIKDAKSITVSPSKFIKTNKSVASSKDSIKIDSALYLKVEGKIESMSIKEPFKASNFCFN